MKFTDLFAGLGGLHQALAQRGAECVFASELNTHLSALYEKNFGIEPHGDIRAVDLASIPDHDVLCAGFPCQPFSKAGDQKGLECPQWGNLFDYVVEILKLKQPRYFIADAELDAIWVGRDLGYRGGRRTGLALTDDVYFADHLERWGLDVQRPTYGKPVA